jgi:peptidoglycan-associated lipoprotein
MKKLIGISLFLFSAFFVKAQEDSLKIEDAAQYYAAMNSENLTLYKDNRVVFFENGEAFTALLDENLEKTDVKPAPELNALGIDGHFAFDPVNQKIYFSKNGELHSAEWQRNKWKKSKKIEIVQVKAERKTLPGSIMAYSGWRYKPEDIVVTGIYNPSISADGKRLYYSADFTGTLGGLDIWYSDIDVKGNISSPINLGETVNSPADENTPFVSAQTALFFSSVPRSSQKNDNTTNPDLLTKEDNEQLLFVPLDLSMLPLPLAELLPDENQNIEVEMQPSDSLTPDTILYAQASEEEKEDVGKENSPEQQPEEATEKTKEPIIPALAHFEEKSQNVFIKNPKTCVFLFDFDKSNLVGQQDEIDMIIEFLNFYKDGEFLIVGYTDERGSYEYNENLSQRRAKQIYDILIKRGIPKSKLSYIGLGKLNPIIRNAQSEEEHQMNRRVEIQNMN